MSTSTSERSQAFRGTTVALKIQYYDSSGSEEDPDSTPKVQISNSQGKVIVESTSDDVTRLSKGLYVYYYNLDDDVAEGLWEDYWTTTLDGITLRNYFSFLVLDEGDLADFTGSVKLGDSVEFDFSEEELKGLNILLKYLKCRLRSNGRKPLRDKFGAFKYDAYGNHLYEECNVFSDEILACFLCQALSEFNMIPFFTSYSFADRAIFTTFAQLLVEGAYIVALASQSLLEKGRDFSISDGSISYQPPQLGDFLSSHYSNWLSSYRERLKFIKNNIRPGPVGYGTFTNLGSAAPAVTRLRHLRARRII